NINLNITGDSSRQNEESRMRKLLAGKEVRKKLPILQWLPNYTTEKLLADLVAGITIGLTILPQGLAYASLGGLPPQYGLYSSFVGCIIYIFLGSTTAVTIGPTAVLAIMTLSYSSGQPPAKGVMLGLLTGIVTLFMGVFKLGFIVNFISAPVNSAFTSAAAITICSTQIKALLGLSYPAEGFLSIITGAVDHIYEVKLNDTLLSIACIVTLLVLQHIPNVFSSYEKSYPKLHKWLWLISVARNAIVIVVCTVIFTIMGPDATHVKVVGNITSGLPPFQLPPLHFWDSQTNATYSFGTLLKEDASAIVVMPLLALMEHITIAKAFAGTSRVDASQEMLTIGVANIIGTFFSSMSVTGSFSRTAVNHASGVQSPMGGLFTGILVLLSLQFLTPYFYFIPKASLGAVIVCAVIFNVDFAVLYPMWKTKKMDLLPWAVTFIISLLVGLEFGILSGLIISIVFLLYYAARPGVRVSKGETLSGVPFILVASDRSLVFPAIEYTRYIILKSGRVWGKDYLPVVIDCQHIHYADFTAAQGMRDLFKMYNEKKQELILWRIKPSIVRILTQVMEVANVPFKHCSTEAELEVHLLQSHVQNTTVHFNNGLTEDSNGSIDITRRIHFSNTDADEDMDMDNDNTSNVTVVEDSSSGSSSPPGLQMASDRRRARKGAQH
ncbi:Sodium-independent sulfate anion transporter, partial [Orchesella cincta]